MRVMPSSLAARSMVSSRPGAEQTACDRRAIQVAHARLAFLRPWLACSVSPIASAASISEGTSACGIAEMRRFLVRSPRHTAPRRWPRQIGHQVTRLRNLPGARRVPKARRNSSEAPSDRAACRIQQVNERPSPQIAPRRAWQHAVAGA